MTSRLSLAEARRLGIIKDGDVPRRPAPRANLNAVPAAPRRAHKGGRVKRAAIGVELPFESRFVINCEPRTKQRARTQMSSRAILEAFSRARGSYSEFERLLKAVPSRSFTPKETKEYEDLVAQIAKAAMRSMAPVERPVCVEIAFEMEGDPETWPTDVTDPDLDNAKKAILDGCNRIVWKDDRLVCRAVVSKICSRTPRTTVIVTPA